MKSTLWNWFVLACPVAAVACAMWLVHSIMASQSRAFAAGEEVAMPWQVWVAGVGALLSTVFPYIERWRSLGAVTGGDEQTHLSALAAIYLGQRSAKKLDLLRDLATMAEATKP